MKINFFRKGILLLGFSALLLSCTDTDPDNIFGKNPDERIEERKAELRGALLSSTDGWKMTYFTDDSELGGFSYIFKFVDGRNVTMISDFNTSTLVAQNELSSYNVILGSTVGLVFDTANYIHYLSDNSRYPNNNFKGEGYRGDFQFNYYGLEGEDVINFKSNRKHIDVKFEKATAQDWTDLSKNFGHMDKMVSARTLVLFENGELPLSLNFRYNRATRYASVLNADRTISVNENGGLGIGFNANGIVISPAIEFEDGSSLSELTFDGSKYIGSVNGNNVVIQ